MEAASGDNSLGMEINTKHLALGIARSKCAINYVYEAKQLKVREL